MQFNKLTLMDNFSLIELNESCLIPLCDDFIRLFIYIKSKLSPNVFEKMFVLSIHDKKEGSYLLLRDLQGYKFEISCALDLQLHF